MKKYLILFCIVAASCSSTPVGGRLNQTGAMLEGNIPNVTLVTKDFETVGMIFVESEATVDGDGKLISGSKITYEMLMMEAQKLGADDIANLRIDEIQKRTTSTSNSNSNLTHYGFVASSVVVDTTKISITYRAYALAIKYLP